MDENEDLLQDLIEHSKKRPKYACMVSWEFKNETKKSHRKKKQLQQESIKELEASKGNEEKDKEFSSSSSAQEEEYDSESSYYSAEEVIDSEESTGSLEEALDGVNLQNDTSCVNYPSQANSRYRAPSKKQKRKRRYQLTYFDQILPFMNCGLSIEEDIQEVVAEIQGKQIVVLREVPSLSFLCIKMLRGIRFPSDSMPSLLKSQIYGANTDLQFKKFQYGWLLNMLALIEKREDYYLFWSRKSGINKYVQVMVLPMCSVWYPLPYLKGSRIQLTDVYNMNKVTACMMYTSGHATLCPIAIQYGCAATPYEILWCMPWILSVSALGTLIECMLPSQISQRKRKGKVPYQSEEAELRMATITASQRIKYVLSKRLPKTVAEFFKVALPYAFWARGDIHNATELFCQLSQSQKRCRYKALFLNEAGRMHTMSGETTSAAKFYRLASEAALSKPKNTLHVPEIEGQAMMLLAGLNDQGNMKGKAQSSWNSWRAVFACESYVSDGAALTAVEHWLCFHAGSWQGDYLGESIRRLIPLCTQHPKLLYHLSLVHALRGDAQNSLQCYCEFRDKVFGSNLPGVEMVHKRSDNPWLPLVDVARKQGQITCIPVLWRTQLRPLCVQTKPRVTQEADIVSEQLNLRMTPQGFLTGDMQLLAPPCGGIYLDPYTGMITYNNNGTEPWRGVMKTVDPSDSDLWMLIIPTPLEVYHDEDGVSVHLLMTSQTNFNLYKFNEFSHNVCHLIWRGPNGRKVKVNLITKFADLIYQRVEEKLKNKIHFPEESQRQMALDALLALHNKGCGLDAITIATCVKRNTSEYSQKSSKKDKDRKKERKKPRMGKGRKHAFKLVAEPVMFGKAVAMIFDHCDPYAMSNFLVIANCSTAEKFLKMKIYYKGKWSRDFIHYNESQENPYNIRPCQLYQGYRINNAEVIHFYCSHRLIEIYDQEGSMVETVPQADTAGHGVLLQRSIYKKQVYPLIIKDQLIAINQEKRLLCFRNGEEFYSPDIENATSVAAFGDILIVLMDNKTQFVAAHQLRILNINITKSCQSDLKLRIGESRQEIEQSFKTVQVLSTQTVTRDSGTYLLCIAALDRTIVCLEVPIDTSKCTEVTVFLTLTLAGYPVEAYFISKTVGFLVTFTQHNALSEAYIEHLCHYNFDGKLLGVLPCLGPGPRSFCHTHLPGDPEGGSGGLYLYMRDGHNGIVGINLNDYHH
ncbi:uncharacterized protein LOC133196158 [Saccostrea echinata]|uniref:uncharacterized protein LOC133196158 n=1 Tax=Saccostrea echinata TaxID=191078 RepID=UPI002A7FDF56|nr:uncharacterized protein LOC133196158 [Saccostrea echinata]